MTLTDNLPASVSAPLALDATAGNAVYNSANRQVSWQGTIASGDPITITFPVTVLLSSPQPVFNTAILTDTPAGQTTSTAVFIANAYRAYLPQIQK